MIEKRFSVTKPKPFGVRRQAVFNDAIVTIRPQCQQLIISSSTKEVLPSLGTHFTIQITRMIQPSARTSSLAQILGLTNDLSDLSGLMNITEHSHCNETKKNSRKTNKLSCNKEFRKKQQHFLTLG